MGLKAWGKKVVTTHGKPVQITTDATAIMMKSVQFQALPGNSGLIYIGLAGMVVSTGVGVLAVLPAPTDATKGPFPTQTFGDMLNPAKLSLNQLWLDSSVDGEGVFVSSIDER